MGAYASNLHEDTSDTIVADKSDPSKPGWLSMHTAATGCKSQNKHNMFFTCHVH